MKRTWKVIPMLALGAVMTFTSCKKEQMTEESADEVEMLSEVVNEDADMEMEGTGYERRIAEELVRSEDCRFIVSGVIEWVKDGEVIGSIDFGDGECDSKAMVTKRGETFEIDLRRRKRPGRRFEKKVIKPLVRTEDCRYIVEGTVELYNKDGELVATIDFGDGECDDIATKTLPDGTVKEFSMERHCKGKRPDGKGDEGDKEGNEGTDG